MKNSIKTSVITLLIVVGNFVVGSGVGKIEKNLCAHENIVGFERGGDILSSLNDDKLFGILTSHEPEKNAFIAGYALSRKQDYSYLIINYKIQSVDRLVAFELDYHKKCNQFFIK
ncbi:MAG: hypothetical protein ACJATA_001280 [Sphingobacteriales bacterium]|jgi:hypothetical protein